MKLTAITLFLLSLTLATASEVYELRIYHLNSSEDAARWDGWMSASGLAQLKQSGASQVGVFQAKPGETNYDRTVLAVYPSLAAMKDDYGASFTLPGKAGEAYLSSAPDKPAYTRIEGSLLVAFPSFKKLVDPAGDGSGERFFELRTYESPSERMAALKLEMFGEGGELDIFNEVALRPVFFGSARVASNLPQLTYMLVHEDEAAMQKAWGGFGKSEAWNKLKDVARYKGTVSKIHKHLLVALPFSELK